MPYGIKYSASQNDPKAFFFISGYFLELKTDWILNIPSLRIVILLAACSQQQHPKRWEDFAKLKQLIRVFTFFFFNVRGKTMSTFVCPWKRPIHQAAENHQLVILEEWEEWSVLCNKKSKALQWKLDKSDTPQCHWESTFFLAMTVHTIFSPQLPHCKSPNLWDDYKDWDMIYRWQCLVEAANHTLLSLIYSLPHIWFKRYPSYLILCISCSIQN